MEPVRLHQSVPAPSFAVCWGRPAPGSAGRAAAVPDEADERARQSCLSAAVRRVLRGLRAGANLPPAPDLAAGYGEPTLNFNPPVICYLVAFFHALGANFIAAENLACFALLVLAGFGMYLLAAEFVGPRGGLVAAAAYFCSLSQFSTYVRHSSVDLAAFPFIPLAVWGSYRFAEEGRYRFLIVGALSTALLFLSSSSVALCHFRPLCFPGRAGLRQQAPLARVLIRGVCASRRSRLGRLLRDTVACGDYLHTRLSPGRTTQIPRPLRPLASAHRLALGLWLVHSGVAGRHEFCHRASAPGVHGGSGATLVAGPRSRAPTLAPDAFFLLLIGLSVFFTVDASRLSGSA